MHRRGLQCLPTTPAVNLVPNAGASTSAGSRAFRRHRSGTQSGSRAARRSATRDNEPFELMRKISDRLIRDTSKTAGRGGWHHSNGDYNDAREERVLRDRIARPLRTRPGEPEFPPLQQYDHLYPSRRESGIAQQPKPVRAKSGLVKTDEDLLFHSQPGPSDAFDPEDALSLGSEDWLVPGSFVEIRRYVGRVVSGKCALTMPAAMAQSVLVSSSTSLL
jgi:hypothetical protein